MVLKKKKPLMSYWGTMKLMHNKALIRTKTAVTFFAKTRKKTAINFGPIAWRYVKQVIQRVDIL